MKKKNAAAVELGKRGGKRRKETLTPERRSEIARKAGLASGKVRSKKAPAKKKPIRTDADKQRSPQAQ